MAEGDFGERFTATFEAGSDLEHARGTVRGKHELQSDEPPWLPVGGGTDDHPAPVDYLVSSLVLCQLSVLSQALEKARVEEYHLSADAEVDRLGRGDVAEGMPPNTANRIEHIAVDVTLSVSPEDEARARRCLEVYDSGCIVGQSLRAGVSYTPEATVELSE